MFTRRTLLSRLRVLALVAVAAIVSPHSRIQASVVPPSATSPPPAVLTIEGLDTYILVPRDPSDLDLLIIRPAACDADEPTWRAQIADLDLDDVDIESFLRLTGEHYYTYPALVRERAKAIRTGKLTVEGT